MIKAVIFDMDGVMVDTEHLHSKAFENVLSEYGIIAERNANSTVHISGATTTETWDILKAKYNLKASTAELTQKKRDALVKLLQGTLQPMPGLLQLLDQLERNNMVMAVATSAQRERANLVVDELGIGNYFKTIVTANDINNGKPAPDVYLKAAERLGIAPHLCVVVEDAEIGIQSAKAAGMKAVAVPNEYTKNMNFVTADLIVDSLEALNYETIVSLA